MDEHILDAMRYAVYLSENIIDVEFEVLGVDRNNLEKPDSSSGELV